MVPEPSVTRATTADLLARARAGSPEAITELYHSYGSRIYQAAFRITGNRADAEDVVQDVFLGLQTALADYREEGKLGGWLATIATRAALMRVRRRRREQPLPPFGDAAPAAPGINAAVRTAALDLLNRMPEPMRQVFLLKEVEGYRHHEIATLLGISAGASEVRLHRAWRFIESLSEDQ